MAKFRLQRKQLEKPLCAFMHFPLRLYVKPFFALQVKAFESLSFPASTLDLAIDKVLPISESFFPLLRYSPAFSVASSVPISVLIMCC